MTINIAILGPGGIAEGAHAPAVAASASARLWSVYSRSAERAREFARRHNARSPTPAYTDLDELLADPELDAVLVATPDRLHAGHAMRAAAAGKHVLCEKPLVTELDDGRALLDACEQAGVVLAVATTIGFMSGCESSDARSPMGLSARRGTFGCTGLTERRMPRTGALTTTSAAGGVWQRTARTFWIWRAGFSATRAAK